MKEIRTVRYKHKLTETTIKRVIENILKTISKYYIIADTNRISRTISRSHRRFINVHRTFSRQSLFIENYALRIDALRYMQALMHSRRILCLVSI